MTRVHYLMHHVFFSRPGPSMPLPRAGAGRRSAGSRNCPNSSFAVNDRKPGLSPKCRNCRNLGKHRKMDIERRSEDHAQTCRNLPKPPGACPVDGAAGRCGPPRIDFRTSGKSGGAGCLRFRSAARCESGALIRAGAADALASLENHFRAFGKSPGAAAPRRESGASIRAGIACRPSGATRSSGRSARSPPTMLAALRGPPSDGWSGMRRVVPPVVV